MHHDWNFNFHTEMRIRFLYRVKRVYANFNRNTTDTMYQVYRCVRIHYLLTCAVWYHAASNGFIVFSRCASIITVGYVSG